MTIVARLLAWFRARLVPRDDDDLLEPVDADFVALEEDGAAVEAASIAPDPAEKEASIEQFFTKMPGAGEKAEVTVEIKDILAPAAPAAEPAASVKEPEKPKEPPAGGGKEDGGLMSSLFEADEAEENTVTAALIASLPDVTAEELLYDIQEVRQAMLEVTRKSKGSGGQEPAPAGTGDSVGVAP